MRSYGQYCALARSLDVLGDRWTLLIIRELFARENRYSDLRDGLPGIATNLLADRLRALQDDGLVEAYEAPPPVRATVYRLTPRGRELAPVLRSLVAWGMPLLDVDRGDDAFRPQWLLLVLRTLYADIDTSGIDPISIVIETEHEPISVEAHESSVEVSIGDAHADADVNLVGDPHDIYRVLAGNADTRTRGRVTVTGSDADVDRLNGLIAATLVTPARNHV